MTKNIKSIFFVLTLVMLLITVGAVCAADNANSTITASDTNVIDAATVSDITNDQVAAEPVTTKSNDNKVDTKTIEKEERNVKTATKTVEVNNIDELTTTFNEISTDTENDEYIINLNEGTYTLKKNINLVTDKNITINGNNQLISGSARYRLNLTSQSIQVNNLNLGNIIYFNALTTLNNINSTKIIHFYNNSNITNSNLYIANHASSNTYNSTLTRLYLYNESILTCYNTTIDGEITNEGGTIIIRDDCTIGNNFFYNYETNTGTIITNKTELRKYEGNMEINNENITIEVTIPVTGNITFTNCQINAKITNNGNLTLVNCSLSNNTIDYAMDIFTGRVNDGLLLHNLGNASIINCIVENNLFNDTKTAYSSIFRGQLIGAISNQGNLEVINTTFCNNTVGYKIHVNDGSYFGSDYICGGAGCIYNNGGNLTIDNSLFKDNYAGNDSGAILSTNNYTSPSQGSQLVSEASIFINNSYFINNSANNTRVGLRISGKDTRIENTTITDCSIIVNTNLILDSCTLNNGRLDFANYNITATDNILNGSGIYASAGAEVINNTFTNQSKLSTTSTRYNITIHDNKFVDNNYTSNSIILAGDQSNTQVYNNTYVNTGLNDSMVWTIPPKVYVNDTISASYKLGNPEYYDADLMDNFTFDVYVDDELYMTTTTLDAITLNKTGDIILKVKPLKSSQTFRQNIEVFKLQDVVITPENYDTYIVDGTLTRVKEDDRVLFQGNFTDKGTIYVDTDDVVIDGYDAHFTNTCFVIDSQNTIIQHLNIDNTDTTYPINNIGKNNYIINNNINLTNVDGLTAAIKNTASKVTIKDNVLYVDGPAKTIDYTENGISNTQAILVVGTNKNIIQNNTITVTTTTEGEVYGTIEAITTNGVTDTNITQNTIYASNAKFTYGINMLAGVSDNSITQNNITVTSYRYCDGIQVGNQAENILIQDNNINIYCHNTTPVDEEAISYGIITTNMGQGTSDHINIYYNNITIDSTVGYGIEVYQTTNTEIRFNNINVTGAYSMGIGYAHSPNSHVVANNIYCQADSTTTLASVTEEIQPETVGIKIQQDSTNIKIDDGWTYGGSIPGANTIHTNDKAGTDYAINVESTGATITGNKLRSTNKTGSDAIKNNTQYSSSNGNGADNIYTNIKIQTPETIIVNQTTTITITIKDEYGENLQLITQDLNNPIYNEETNTVYYPYIKDNITVTLTIDDQTENITITENTITYNYTPTTAGTHNITATFQERTGYKIEEGQTQYLGNYNTTTTTKTLTVSTITLTVDPITANIGDTINITARITLGNQTYTDINSGKITFKVNGKTLKDANGKVIYAKVTDGIATIYNYIVPNDWSKENTTIQAVYSGSKQCNKLTSEKTQITITASEPTLTITPITSDVQTGSTVTLKAKVAAGDKAITTGKVVFKVNGKTVKDANGKVIYAKVDSNGEVNVDYTIPESFKAGTYNIEAVFTASGYDKLTSNTTMTVVKS
ncbi:MAG: Ig-like domain repeat protein [Methanosphaera sp.]|nr:Ig-like domain repeat protein [Methanosphaera sp.]